jgi:hypothetical protein
MTELQSLKNQQVPTNSFYLQTLINMRNVENPTSTFANLPCKRTRKEGRKLVHSSEYGLDWNIKIL